MLTMNFSSALLLIKRGMKLTRTGWNGSDMWVALRPGYYGMPGSMIFSNPIREYADRAGGPVEFRSYLMLKTAQGEFVPWVASQTDLLAEDWVRVS